jgi:hypothetical protein
MNEFVEKPPPKTSKLRRIVKKTTPIIALSLALSSVPGATQSEPNVRNTSTITSTQEVTPIEIRTQNTPIKPTIDTKDITYKQQLYEVEIQTLRDQITSDKTLSNILLEEGYKIVESDPERAEQEYFSRWRELESRISQNTISVYELERLDLEQQNQLQEITKYDFMYRDIESLGGEFITAFRLPSGLGFNFYQAGEQSIGNIKIDPDAVNILFNQLLENVTFLPDSPYKTALLDLKNKSKKGLLNDSIINVVINTNYGMCVTTNNNGLYVFTKNTEGIINQLDEERSGDCIATAIQAGFRSSRYNNLLIPMAGNIDPKYNPIYQLKNNDNKIITWSYTPELGWTKIFAHEIVHGLLGLSGYTRTHEDMNNVYDKEHDELVWPLVDKTVTYNYLESIHDNKTFAPISLDN